MKYGPVETVDGGATYENFRRDRFIAAFNIQMKSLGESSPFYFGNFDLSPFECRCPCCFSNTKLKKHWPRMSVSSGGACSFTQFKIG